MTNLADELFATVRAATSVLYPEARISETPMADDVDKAASVERLRMGRVIRHSLWWADILLPLSSIAAADRILSELTGYRESSSWRSDDAEKLAGALLTIAGLAQSDKPDGEAP